MESHDVVVGVLTGCVLLVLGLVPGLFWGLTEGVRNFFGSVSSGLPMSPRPQTEDDRLRKSTRLAGLGAALIVFSVLAYLSN